MPTRAFLRSTGLPAGDLHGLPDSDKRFPDGAQYRVEIPSSEGPRCLEAVLEQAERFDVCVHIARSGFEPTTSELGAAGLAVPVPVPVLVPAHDTKES